MAHKDPITGDELSRFEWLSWQLQQLVIRRPAFLAVITLLTLVTWVRGHIWTHDLTDVWNYAASYLALFIESLVGLAMFNQTRRDAVILREIKKLVAQAKEELEDIEEELDGR